MSFFKSGNPTLSENRFRDTILDEVVSNENSMTVKGTLNKFGFLFLMTLGTAWYSWREASEGRQCLSINAHGHHWWFDSGIGYNI